MHHSVSPPNRAETDIRLRETDWVHLIGLFFKKKNKVSVSSVCIGKVGNNLHRA